jgi:DNA-binding NarL/FixJ family response regulator
MPTQGYLLAARACVVDTMDKSSSSKGLARSPQSEPDGTRRSEAVPASQTIRIVLADDHSLFRESIARVLSERDGFAVVAVAANATQAINAVRQHQPDVALLDVAMPGGGIEAVGEIRTASPETRVVMLSAYGYEHYVASSLRAGAVGYVMKTATMDYLCAAIRMVHNGETVFDFTSRATTPDRLLAGQTVPDRRLSDRPMAINPRELDVLQLVAKGMGNREIAHVLSISERTVQAHLVNVFGKLGVKTRTAAVMQCVAAGIIEVQRPAS